MTDQHPITLPSELVHEWVDMLSHRSDYAVFSLAAQWGANQELEACCQYISGEGEWFAYPGHRLAELRAARRPKPPSLKEQALDELTSAEHLYPADWSTIRRALEALPND